MTQATYSIRLDQDKKAEFDQICERLGLSASAAISTFVNKTVEERGLPYQLKLNKPTPSDFGILEEDKLTREELLDKVQESLDGVERGEKTYTLDEAFGELLGVRYARV